MRASLFLVVSFLSTTALATETVVVTATRIATPSSGVASANSVVGKDGLAAQGSNNAADLLQGLPGVQIRSSGGAGQSQSLFIRGGNADHSLVLIDGITANDPMTTNGSYDFSNLNSWNWERAEVIRGPQSGLYGSEAMSGVVQFFSPKPKYGEPETTLATEIGNCETRSYNARWAKRYRSGYASISGNYATSLGISAADEALGNKESDGYRRQGLSFTGEKDIGKNTEVSLVTHYFDNRAELDTQGGFAGDAVGYNGRTRTLLARAQAKSLHLDDKLESQLGLNLSQNKREYENPNSYYKSGITKADWQHHYHLTEEHTLSAGIDIQQETGSSNDILDEKHEQLTGVYLQHSWQGRLLFSDLSARDEWYQRFGQQTTFRAAPGIKLFDGKSILHGSYGTAFKAPDLFQTYSSYGSLNIAPEKSHAVDAGLTQELGRPDLKANIEYFSQHYTNLITSSPVAPFKSVNTGAARTHGWEMDLNGIATDSLQLGLSATRLFSYNESTKRALVRRPDWSGRLMAGYQITKAIDLTGQCQYVGHREDVEPDTGAAKQMPSYNVFNLASNWKMSNIWTVGARLENITNKKYQDVAGYGTAGRSFYAHIQASL